MASSIPLPEDRVAWFVKGNALGIVSTYSSSGTTRTERKRWQAVDHAVTDGLLVHYWADPNKVTAISEIPDIDNVFHMALVDYIKMCLYMDRAGTNGGEVSAVALQLSQMHRAKFDQAVRHFGSMRREKTGGVRAILPFSFQ